MKQKKETTKKEVKKAPKKSKAKSASLNEALFNFQAENLSVPRKGTGEISGRKYNYATLDDLITTIRPALQSHGLVFTQIASGTDLTTKLIHVASKEELSGTLPLGNPASSQDLGSRITYLRRYALISMLGLVIDEDVDGISSGQPAVTVAPKQAEKAPTAPVAKETVNAPVEPPLDQKSLFTSKSEAYLKAVSMVEAVTEKNAEALEIIKGHVERSKKLNMEEQNALLEMIRAKDDEFHGTVR